jgi:hypothetical protein
VLKALKAIYQRNGDQLCSQEEILEAGKAIDPSASPECIVVGMLFAIDFQTTYVQTWSASPSNDNVTLSLATSARLLSFEDIGSAWSQDLKNRVNSTDMVRPAQRKSGSPVFETTGEVYTSQEIIGEGGIQRKYSR